MRNTFVIAAVNAVSIGTYVLLNVPSLHSARLSASLSMAKPDWPAIAPQNRLCAENIEAIKTIDKFSTENQATE
jgi:hypothetical protein